MGLLAANPKPLKEREPSWASPVRSERATDRRSSAENPALHAGNLAKRCAWRGRHCIPQCDPANSWSFRSKNLQKNRRVQEARTTGIVGRCRKRHLSRDAACGRNRVQPRTTATETGPQPPNLSIGPRFRHHRSGCLRRIARAQPLRMAAESRKASQPFRRDSCARHHPWHANGLRLPCRNSARAQAWSLPCPGPAST